jgi:hypothetical protein
MLVGFSCQSAPGRSCTHREGRRQMACRLSYSTTARGTGPDMITALFVGNLAGSGRPGAHRPTRQPVPAGGTCRRRGRSVSLAPSIRRSRAHAPVLRAPLPAPFLSQAPSPSPGGRSGEHHAQPRSSFIFRRRHRVCARTGCGRGGGDRRRPAAGRRADRMRCAPALLVGGGGRRGRSCDTPPPPILIPASPRYFWLPGAFPPPTRRPPRQPPRLHSHIGPGDFESTSDFACFLPRRRPPSLSLSPRW